MLLNNPANNVGTVGGGAAGRFEYVDADALTLGPVSVTGFDAAGNLPQVVSASSMAADTVLVRTLTGDLSLGSNVSSGSGADLVAAARFQNLGRQHHRAARPGACGPTPGSAKRAAGWPARACCPTSTTAPTWACAR